MDPKSNVTHDTIKTSLWPHTHTLEDAFVSAVAEGGRTGVNRMIALKKTSAVLNICDGFTFICNIICGQQVQCDEGSMRPCRVTPYS